MDKMCKHLNFKANVAVGRITESEGDTDPIGYVADITVHCADCQVPFHFRGVDYGFSPREPRLAVGGLELHAPIAPGKLDFTATNIRYETFASELITSDEIN